MLSLKQGTPSGLSESSEPQAVVESSSEEKSAKRRLRSHKAEENEFIIELGAVASPASSSDVNSSQDDAQPAQMSSLSLLRNLLPANVAVSSKARELLQNILAWQILPTDAPAEPSMIYGSIHLCRLVVKLPDFLNASTMQDEKLKLLLQYLDCFIE